MKTLSVQAFKQLGFHSVMVTIILFGCGIDPLQAQSNYAAPYTFTTFAGTAGTAGGLDGTGTAATFNYPAGLTIGHDGNIYVTDVHNGGIRKITPTGDVTLFAFFFNDALGVTEDANSNFYVADTANQGVRKLSSNGELTLLAGAFGVVGSSDSTDGTGATARFNHPSGIAVNASGVIYVADTGNHTIRKVTPAGVVTTLAGLAGVHGSSDSTDGTGSTARFFNPTDIAIDANGILYVTDQSNNTIRRITQAGLVTTIAGTAGVAGSADGTGPAAQFNGPLGITVDTSGNLYVTDYVNQLIREISPTGVVTTLAGTPGVQGSDDGPGSAALFHTPGGIKVDSNRNLYVCDENNFTIRKGTPPLTPQIPNVASATNITATTAKLNGTFNAYNNSTTVVFQYGTDGVNFPNQVSSTPSTFSGFSDTPVSATATGLVDGTTYFYRISATNNVGTTVSSVGSFIASTTPSASLTAVTAQSTTSAKAFGTYNAQGTNALVYFNYGTDPTMAVYNSVQASPGVANGYADTPVNAVFTNLAQGTTYYYQLRGSSGSGVILSPINSFQVALLSGFLRQFPNPLPSSNGFVLVSLIPSGINSGWRFVGEQLWRNSGVPAFGLTTGNFNIEYRPVPGYIQPPQETISVTSGGAATIVNEEYYPAANGGQVGGLSVSLQPSELAASTVLAATRAQWRFLGEDDTQWKDSGTTVSNLIAGTYLIECKPVSGQTTPPPSSVVVPSGQTTLVTLTYFLTGPAIGAQPAVLSFSTVTNSSTPSLPYAFVGQIRSDVGSATGFVVQNRVVATAGHVVFDDGSLNYVTGLQWLFQRSSGVYDPVPQVPQGFYVFDGYAAQRTTEHTPGVSSPDSQNLDAAALYFLAPAGNSGYSGYLASDAATNEFLVSSRQKMLVGYPVDGISASSQGQMFATASLNATFAQVSGTDGNGKPYRVYTTSDLTSVGGNSGGPLCVQFDDGNYYPAAIYLGGSAQTVVRSIDSAVVDLFNRAEVSGNGGANNTGGGITQINTSLSGGSASYASIRILFAPAAVTSSATWAIGTVFFHNGDSISGRSPGLYTLTVTPVAGYVTPTSTTVTLTGGQLSTITVTYQPVVVPPQNVTFTSASTIPITTSSYSVNGAALNLILSYAPTPGTVLTAIQITGGTAISGAFTNLPNGGKITATFNGFNYTFTANYSGGSSGHDLTLTLTSSGPSSTDTPTMPTWALIMLACLLILAAHRELQKGGMSPLAQAKTDG